MDLCSKVIKKMDEYGIKIFHDYEIKGEDEKVFYVEDMILFVNDKENSIGISMQATTKPDRAATLAIIVCEIKCKHVHVMESFIFNHKNEFISGEKAYNLVNQSNKLKAIEEANKQAQYAKLLERAKCHEC
jgi:hypothetical protein